MARGIASRRVEETPIAIVDFETTGLNAGTDRVVEVSVMRLDPGTGPKLVLDTLVNPDRNVAATEIHGITDADVVDAPRFADIAGEMARAISDCVVAAYNVYFDMRFFEYEMKRAGIADTPPHFCLMYMRPMLGLGRRCRLGEACSEHGITYDERHIAAEDVDASARLLNVYLEEMRAREIRTFRDLAKLRNYKFVRSFDWNPILPEAIAELPGCDCLKSRLCICQSSVADTETVDSRKTPRKANTALGFYWEALKVAVADLEITEEEVEHLREIAQRHGLAPEQVRVLHARAFASVISQFIDDQWLDDKESRKLKRLHQCLSKLGWAPGE